MNQSICVLIPAKNEAETIGNVLDTMPKLNNMSVVVADGFSKDGTYQIALDKGARVIHGRGEVKGKDVRLALQWIDADFVYMLDADGTYPPSFISVMHEYLIKDRYDVIVGNRFKHMQKDAMTLRNNFGNRMLTLLANILYRTKTPDLCTGLWGFNRKALESMHLVADGFDIEANLFTEVNRNKLRLGSIDIVYKNRSGTKPKLKMSDGFIIAKRLIVERFR